MWPSFEFAPSGVKKFVCLTIDHGGCDMNFTTVCIYIQ